MTDFAADKSHPRYESLLKRHYLEDAAKKGMLADSAMIAHGRGEAFDYLLGEQTTDFALQSTKNAVGHLANAKRPVICLNGNTTALAGYELMKVAEILNCPIEVNIFYRTEQRINVIFEHLNEIKDKHSLNVELLGETPDSLIPGLKGPRAKCCKKGIIDSDVILVPLEDGDRCEALVAMGKTVIVVDLNPLSRSAQMASITIVDEITRVANNMIKLLETNKELEIDIEFDNSLNLKKSLEFIASKFSNS